jgi:hypothetical protein
MRIWSPFDGRYRAGLNLDDKGSVFASRRIETGVRIVMVTKSLERVREGCSETKHPGHRYMIMIKLPNSATDVATEMFIRPLSIRPS